MGSMARQFLHPQSLALNRSASTEYAPFRESLIMDHSSQTLAEQLTIKDHRLLLGIDLDQMSRYHPEKLVRKWSL